MNEKSTLFDTFFFKQRILADQENIKGEYKESNNKNIVFST